MRLAGSSLKNYERYRELAESLVESSLALTRSSMLILGMRKGKGRAGRVGGLLGGFGGDEEQEEENGLGEEEEEGLAMLTIAADACILTKCLAGGGGYRESFRERRVVFVWVARADFNTLVQTRL